MDGSIVAQSTPLRAFSGTAFPGHRLELCAVSCTPWSSGGDEGREKFNALDFFPDHPDELELWPKGCYPGEKLQLHPTNLTYSTAVIGRKDLG